MNFDDFQRLRLRRDVVAGRRPARRGGLPPAFVGQVTTTAPQVGKYCLVHPVDVLGTESERSAGSLAVDATQSIPVYLLGPKTPATGDNLIVRRVDHRWVADQSHGPHETFIALPGCLCPFTPAVVTMTSSNTTANHGIFQNATLRYGPIPSGYALLAIGTLGYLSDQSFIDQQSGDSFRYFFSCLGGVYSLTRVYLTSIFGSPFRDSPRYSWFVGTAGNTCVPFLLSNGTIFTGGDPSSVVVMSDGN